MRTRINSSSNGDTKRKISQHFEAKPKIAANAANKKETGQTPSLMFNNQFNPTTLSTLLIERCKSAIVGSYCVSNLRLGEVLRYGIEPSQNLQIYLLVLQH